jgi:RNA polymerase sigma factor (sigma-70 family)
MVHALAFWLPNASLSGDGERVFTRLVAWAIALLRALVYTFRGWGCGAAVSIAWNLFVAGTDHYRLGTGGTVMRIELKYENRSFTFNCCWPNMRIRTHQSGVRIQVDPSEWIHPKERRGGRSAQLEMEHQDALELVHSILHRYYLPRAQGREGSRELLRDANRVHEISGVVTEILGHMERRLDCLEKREREILKLRYGVNGYRHTLQEVGNQLRLSRERIRQLQKRALGELDRRDAGRP